MSTALLTRPEAKPPAEPVSRRTRPRRILGAAFASAVLAGTAVAVIDGGAAAAPPAGSCLSARTLPCGAATGTTIARSSDWAPHSATDTTRGRWW